MFENVAYGLNSTLFCTSFPTDHNLVPTFRPLHWNHKINVYHTLCINGVHPGLPYPLSQTCLRQDLFSTENTVWISHSRAHRNL